MNASDFIIQEADVDDDDDEDDETYRGRLLLVVSNCHRYLLRLSFYTF